MVIGETSKSVMIVRFTMGLRFWGALLGKRVSVIHRSEKTLLSAQVRRFSVPYRSEMEQNRL